MKYPYSIRVLSELLAREEKYLVRWKKTVDAVSCDSANIGDVLSLRQALGNIPNCEHRINELKQAIMYLNSSI